MAELRSVIPVFQGQQLCLPLVTTREFGRWIVSTYEKTNPALVQIACYINSAEGRPYHPGTPINGFFTKHPVINKENRQRSFVLGSEVCNYLLQNGFSQVQDANKLVGSDNTSYNVFKLYTIVQIELFMKYLLNDKSFTFNKHPELVAIPEKINCEHMPIFLYDETEESAIDNRISLFSKCNKNKIKNFKKRAPIRNRYSDRGVAGISFYSKGVQLINLYKMNTRALKWDYVRAFCNVMTKEIQIEQGSKEWHDAKIRKDGRFTLGKKELTDKFPELIPGRYVMDYIEEEAKFVIHV